MAKKAKRRPLRVSKAISTTSNSTTENRPYHASNIIHPDNLMAPTQKRRCTTARQKSHTHLQDQQQQQQQQQQQSATPTLADRFHSLPPELRREIFSLLLVKPVKWQLPHTTTTLPSGEEKPCPQTTNPWSAYPRLWDEDRNTCIRCRSHQHTHTRVPLWRHLQDQDPNVPDWHKSRFAMGHVVWRNPWRSVWAPEVGNEFLCSECWDLEMRPRPHPAMEEIGKRHLRCLCARRGDLGVLLVCKRWYEEAGAVFYARNTFAFESAAVFKAFIISLSQRWREKVSRVSIMAYHPSEPSGPNEEASGWEGNRKVLPIFSLLHKLPRLSYLELDAHFLTRPKIAHRMLKLSHPNVRRVCFVMHNPAPLHHAPKPSEWIWPEYTNARLTVGGFAEEVARAIKGQKPRRGLRDQSGTGLKQAVEREEGLEAHVMRYQLGQVETGNAHFAISSCAYSRLWWEEQQKHSSGAAAHLTGLNGLHAYIGTDLTHFWSMRMFTAEMEQETHWRDWTPSNMRDEDFGIQNLALWREKAGWDVLFPIQAEEFLDESEKELKGWEFLKGIEI